MNDEGLKALIGHLDRMDYGYGEMQIGNDTIGYKKHNGRVSQIAIAEAKSTRINGWSELIAYFIDKGKAHQLAAQNGNTETHKISIIVEVNSKGEADRIIENDYKMYHFKTSA